MSCSCSSDLHEHSASPQILLSASLSIRTLLKVCCSSPTQRRITNGYLILTHKTEPRECLIKTLTWWFVGTKGYTSLKTLLSARTEWAEPLHQTSPVQSVLSFSNVTLWKYSFPRGVLAVFSQNLSLCRNSHSWLVS